MTFHEVLSRLVSLECGLAGRVHGAHAADEDRDAVDGLAEPDGALGRVAYDGVLSKKEHVTKFGIFSKGPKDYGKQTL
jgi:hypothetical protein